ncbi:MAG: methionine synthase [Deltaproteobacteria bacterium]|nr:methionine synthase [Deltaproteobacteria bacterium]
MASNVRQARIQALLGALGSRVLVLDGAMGTAIQDKNLQASDFGGPDLEGCNEVLVLTRPELIRGIHEAYLEAGCDIVETNTFGATPLVLDEYGLGASAHEINVAAARLAREAADRYSTPQKPRFVAGAIGPTTKAISVTGGATFESLQEHFHVQAKALFEGGVDYLLLETCQDTRNVKAALLAIDRLFEEKGEKIPVAVSGTIEPMGTMLAGQSAEALMASLANRDLLYLGLNCATGPEFMTDHIRSLARVSPFRIGCVPNAGLPDEHGHYLETPEMVSAVAGRFLESGWLNVIGGCCGTHAGHVAALARAAALAKPRVTPKERRAWLSGVDFLEVTDELRPVIIGERTNVIGSRRFKRLICEEDFEQASEIARAQIKNGAQIIDVCLANPDRDELADMRRFLEIAVKKARVPLMIDSTDEKVIAAALTYCQGKALINSINLENGEERFEKVIPLAKRFGAALVVGTIDDDPTQGMAVTRARKLSVAERSYKLLTEKYGVVPEDIYWDPLVFPCATGDAQYVGSAVETIEGIRLIKQRFPRTKTLLGISNVSFGLPDAGREVLNSVFLYHCVQAGLDLAIVNSEKLVRYSSISEEERKLAEDLLRNRGAGSGHDPIAAFAAHFRGRKAGPPKVDRSRVPLDERLASCVVEGSRDGLIEDLNEALKERRPLDIINGPLMKGMDQVGRLFNQNKLIVAEVLQSAEVMKAAVAHLEPFMERTDSALRGKVILATVKGDVHDIGKNLVDIILTNNGFRVINLGIKIPPEQLIQAVREHRPDIIGLSGLLVKSAQQMAATAEDLARAGVATPVLVGGAALSANFTGRHIARAYATGTVAYARDAMNGLELARMIVEPAKFELLKADLARTRAEALAKQAQAPDQAKELAATLSSRRAASVSPVENPPQPPNYERHIIRNQPIEQIWRFINPLMLYGRHLGIKGGEVRLLEKSSRKADPKSLAIWTAVQELKERYRADEVMKPVAVFRFFRAAGEGNRLVLFNDSSNPIGVFDFPRQPRENGLCLADYVGPLSTVSNGRGKSPDNIALFVVSVGHGVRELATQLKNDGEYLSSHILQALAIESAEAYAELLHAQLRTMWGFPDPTEMTMMERFQAKYRGKRYSFGYPACPRLDDQALLFRLLQPEEIGVQLTEGFMMDPEASVSALVFHHPIAKYFSVGPGAAEGIEEALR